MFLPSFDIRNLVDAAVTYLLSANFNASNYSFSDDEDVNTFAPGSVQSGSLVVRNNNVAADCEILSSKLRLNQENDYWAYLNVSHTEGITRELGKTVINTIAVRFFMCFELSITPLTNSQKSRAT